MATDATGTVTSPDNIPTYNTAADAPSGKGLNAIVAAVQAALTKRPSSDIAALAASDVPVWNGSGWVRPSGVGSASTFLRGDGSWAAPSGAMTLIDDLVVTGSVLATYDTNTRLGGNIPQTYKHLKIIFSGRVDVLGNYTSLNFNNNFTTNYASGQNMYNGTVRADNFGDYGGVTYGLLCTNPGTGETADEFSGWETLIPDYTNSTHRKTWLSSGGSRQQGAKYNGTIWGEYAGSNAAITRISLAVATGGNFVIGTRISLYGLS